MNKRLTLLLFPLCTSLLITQSAWAEDLTTFGPVTQAAATTKESNNE